jgi:hypothetical protein
MRPALSLLLTLVGLLLLAACGNEPPAARSGTTAAALPRYVTLRSHLNGALDQDPELQPGETIRVVPAPGERFVRRDPVTVTLPETTPHEGRLAQYFLRGYALGFASTLAQQPT